MNDRESKQADALGAAPAGDQKRAKMVNNFVVYNTSLAENAQKLKTKLSSEGIYEAFTASFIRLIAMEYKIDKSDLTDSIVSGSALSSIFHGTEVTADTLAIARYIAGLSSDTDFSEAMSMLIGAAEELKPAGEIACSSSYSTLQITVDKEAVSSDVTPNTTPTPRSGSSTEEDSHSNHQRTASEPVMNAVRNCNLTHGPGIFSPTPKHSDQMMDLGGEGYDFKSSHN